MRSRTHLGVTTSDDGFRGAHRTMAKRDLCIMACVFCRDKAFQNWVRIQQLGKVMAIGSHAPPASEESAKAWILETCGVDTRSKLDTDPAAAEHFHQLVRLPFIEWKEAQ